MDRRVLRTKGKGEKRKTKRGSRKERKETTGRATPRNPHESEAAEWRAEREWLRDVPGIVWVDVEWWDEWEDVPEEEWVQTLTALRAWGAQEAIRFFLSGFSDVRFQIFVFLISVLWEALRASAFTAPVFFSGPAVLLPAEPEPDPNRLTRDERQNEKEKRKKGERENNRNARESPLNNRTRNRPNAKGLFLRRAARSRQRQNARWLVRGQPQWSVVHVLRTRSGVYFCCFDRAADFLYI